MDAYRKILKKSHNYLKNEGVLALEIGYDQKEEVIQEIKKTEKYINIESKNDLEGNNRVIIAKKKE